MTETNHLSMPAIAFIYGTAPAYIRYHCDLIRDDCYVEAMQRDLVLFAELLIFAFESEKIVSHFKLANTNTDDPYNLDKWQTYEEGNPDIFAGMYQFWCQKIA